MKKFLKEFKILQYVIEHSGKILLFAHNRPDPDTVGAVLALKEYFDNVGIISDIACFDPLPSFAENITIHRFFHPSQLDLSSYQTIIACDSVERGFEKIAPKLSDKQVIVLFDHHPDITLKGDINMIDSSYSSVCEIIYDFLVRSQFKISGKIATFMVVGILGDTGSFQHSNTTPQVLEIASDLMRKGADNPVAVDGVTMSPARLLEALNTIAGANGIGRADIVENRYVGMKSRGVYETPGGTVLHMAAGLSSP